MQTWRLSMKIKLNNNSTELSYMDLCNGIKLDIDTDESMPESVKKTALTLLYQLTTVITPYSA